MLRGYETGKFPPFRGIWGVHESLSAMQEDLKQEMRMVLFLTYMVDACALPVPDFI